MATTTSNFELNIVEGSDIVNPLIRQPELQQD